MEMRAQVMNGHVISFDGSEPSKAKVEVKRYRSAALDDDALIQRGREAWKRRRSSAAFDDWLLVGEALIVLSRIAEERSGRKRGNRKYNTEMGVLLGQHRLHDIDPSTRAKLMWMAENKAALIAWRRDHMTAAQRADWNAPSTIRREADNPQHGLIACGLADLEKSEAESKKNDQSSKKRRKRNGKQKNPGQKGGTIIEAAAKCMAMGCGTRSWRGQVTDNMVEAAREVVNEWTRTLEYFEEQREAQRQVNRRRTIARLEN